MFLTAKLRGREGDDVTKSKMKSFALGTLDRADLAANFTERRGKRR